MNGIPASRRASSIEYAIRDVVVPAMELERKGHDLIKLNIGDPLSYPGLPTPSHMVDAFKEALERHMKTKQYKRDKKRVLNGPAPHEQHDAEAAAGMGAPDNGKRRTQRAAKDVAME